MKPESKTIVIDANILIRAILGRRTFSIIKENIGSVFFCTPQVCYDEVSFNLPKIAQKRNLNETEAQLTLEILNDLRKLVIPIEEDIYINNRKNALNRIGERDRKDWSILALALTFDCSIWTEDQDFFGTGVTTWRTKNIEIFLGI